MRLSGGKLTSLRVTRGLTEWNTNIAATFGRDQIGLLDQLAPALGVGRHALLRDQAVHLGIGKIAEGVLLPVARVGVELGIRGHEVDQPVVGIVGRRRCSG